MKSTLAFVVVLVALVCAQNKIAQSEVATTKDWSSTLDETCQRCVSSRPEIKSLPMPLPKRAVIYGFTGEFARKTDTWVVNLDTGEIVNREAVSNDIGEWKSTINHLGTVDPDALARLRVSAASLWRSKSYDMLSWFSPGTAEEDVIISGSRLVAFSRFAPDDHDIVAAINSALPSDAAETNGSFVIMPHKQ